MEQKIFKINNDNFHIEIILVNNVIQDQGILEIIASYSEILLIENDRYKGFSENNNIGIKKSIYDSIDGNLEWKVDSNVVATGGINLPMETHRKLDSAVLFDKNNLYYLFPKIVDKFSPQKNVFLSKVLSIRLDLNLCLESSSKPNILILPT